MVCLKYQWHVLLHSYKKLEVTWCISIRTLTQASFKIVEILFLRFPGSSIFLMDEIVQVAGKKGAKRSTNYSF